MSAKDDGSDEHGTTQQQHAQYIGVKYRIAHQDAHESEGGAGRAKGEIKLFLRAMRNPQQDQQDRGDDDVDGEQDDPAKAFLLMN